LVHTEAPASKPELTAIDRPGAAAATRRHYPLQGSSLGKSVIGSDMPVKPSSPNPPTASNGMAVKAYGIRSPLPKPANMNPPHDALPPVRYGRKVERGSTSPSVPLTIRTDPVNASPRSEAGATRSARY